MQSFRQIALKLWKIAAIHNRYPIVVYGVMSVSKKPSANFFKQLLNLSS